MDECKHESIFNIGGKTSDMCTWTLPDGTAKDGYVPKVRGIAPRRGGGGDYLDINICMACRQVVGFEPEDVLALQAETREEEE